jgi:regulator of sigma E protease
MSLENQDRPPDPELTPPGPEQHFRQGQTPPAPPAREATEAPAAEAEPTIRQWIVQHGSVLAIILAGIGLLHYKLGWDLGTIAKVAVGLGFIIFIHELGHFLVAKWCDVHVQTFSIGFGPALPGCKFTWGETTYKLALIPLGGYVQMVGQVDGDESSDGSEDDPRSYRNKSVWQRMAIISAGVTMNALLAVVCFVVVFLGPGKDRKAGVVGSLDTNGPAFKAGVPTGAKVLDVGGVRDPYFEQLMSVVMATGEGDKLTFEYQVKGPSGADVDRSLELAPRPGLGEMRRPLLGIGPAHRLTLLPRRYAGKVFDHPAWPGTAADRAEGPFEFDDQIIATTDPDDPSRVTNLPLDWRKPGSDQRDYFVFARRMQQLAGREVTIRVLRGRGSKRETVDVKVPAAFHNVLDARMMMGQVTVVCDGFTAATDPANHVQPRDPSSSREGDVIEAVELPEPDGGTTTFGSPTSGVRVVSALLLPEPARALYQVLRGPRDLDPERLPDQLRAWAANPKWAGLPEAGRVVTLHLRRHNPPDSAKTRVQYTHVVVRLPWKASRTYEDAQPLYQASPLAIPELGLAYQVKTTVAGVDPRLAGTGENALQPGDVIEKLRLHVVGKDGEVEKGDWIVMASDEWACTFQRLQVPPLVQKVTVQVKRNQESREITVTLRQDRSWPLAERGLVLDYDLRRQKAHGIVEAVAMGLDSTGDFMLQVYQNLRGMVRGDISPRNLGGPLTIARVAYSIAGVDFWEFIFFLGLISINLAVINFLPIPVLDGGHMVFLIYEKIRGKPASEQVRIGATYVGLLLLASLMIFVVYLDISRMVRGG